MVAHAVDNKDHEHRNVLLYECTRPKRGVVVTDRGTVEFRLSGWSGVPASVMATTDHGLLYQGRARSVGRGIALTFGQETVVVRERDDAKLLQAVPATPVLALTAAAGAAATPPVPPPPPPIPPPPPTVGPPR